MFARVASMLLFASFIAACDTGNLLSSLPKSDELALAPKGYQRLFSPAAHAFRYSRPGEPARSGTVSERYELRDGECGGNDCAGARARSEVRQETGESRARLNKDIWYGWSFYNEQIESYSRETSLKTVFGQWKLNGGTPPIFRIVQIGVGEGNWDACLTAFCNRSTDTKADVVVQLEDMRRTYDWGKDENFGNICKLFSIDQARGKWVDLVVNTNFSTKADGYLRIWVDGELKCSYAGQLVVSHSKTAKTPTVRRGIFVSSTQRWRKRNPNKPVPTMIAYYDEFLVGKSRKKVDTLLRESVAASPKD